MVQPALRYSPWQSPTSYSNLQHVTTLKLGKDGIVGEPQRIRTKVEGGDLPPYAEPFYTREPIGLGSLDGLLM